MHADPLVQVRAMDAAVRPPLTLVSALSESDSVNALIWASAAGWIAALAMVFAQAIPLS